MRRDSKNDQCRAKRRIGGAQAVEMPPLPSPSTSRLVWPIFAIACCAAIEMFPCAQPPSGDHCMTARSGRIRAIVKFAEGVQHIALIERQQPSRRHRSMRRGVDRRAEYVAGTVPPPRRPGFGVDPHESVRAVYGDQLGGLRAARMFLDGDKTILKRIRKLGLQRLAVVLNHALHLLHGEGYWTFEAPGWRSAQDRRRIRMAPVQEAFENLTL